MFLHLAPSCNRFYTLGVALAIHTNSISIGMGQGFSAVLLPQLEADTDLHVTTDEASWIASLGVVSTPFGALASGLFAEWIGRKRTMQLTGVPFLIGWLLMALAQGKIWLYAGRFITGFAIGMAATCYIYLAEIARPSERGILSALGPVCVSFGVLLVYCMGYFMNWHSACVVCASMSIISISIIHFLPESPPFLASKGKYEEAQAVLGYLRGSPEDAEKEMTQVLQSINNTKKLSSREYIAQAKDPAVWKPFFILVVFFMFQEGSGLYTIVYYATNIFQDMGAVMESSIESIIVGVVRLLAAAVGSACIQRFDRRTLANVSSLGMGVSMSVAAAYEYVYGETKESERPLAALPLVCLVFHVASSMMGMLQLPWIMIGELFPLKVRGVMGGIVSSLGYLFIFGIIKVYPNLMSSFHLWGMMAFFAVIALATVPFVLAFLPETQGRELIDIENSFRKIKTDSKPDPIFILRL